MTFTLLAVRGYVLPPAEAAALACTSAVLGWGEMATPRLRGQPPLPRCSLVSLQSDARSWPATAPS